MAREEILRLSEEMSRLEATLLMLKENYFTVHEKVKEVPNLKETVKVREGVILGGSCCIDKMFCAV